MARKVMGALVAGAMGTTPALADVYERTFVQQLEAEGFRSISTERTWLGRMRITAESGDGQREIIINPNNGEVLRDLWLVERRGGDESTGSEQAAVTTALAKDQSDDNGGKSDDSDDRKENRRGDGDRSSSKSGDDGEKSGSGNGGRNGGDSDD